MSRLRALLRCPPALRLIVWAFWLSGYYRYLVLHRPFRDIAQRLGESGVTTPRDEQGIDMRAAYRVAKAVATAAQHTPWNTNCLAQAFTAAHLLRRQGIPYTVRMGVRRGASASMEAHAWTRVGGFAVTGGDGAPYTATACFGFRGGMGSGQKRDLFPSS